MEPLSTDRGCPMSVRSSRRSRWPGKKALLLGLVAVVGGCSLSGSQPVGFAARVDVAERMMLSGQHAGAYRLLDEVTDAHSGTPEAELAVGDAYLEAGAFLRAETAYRAAIASGAGDDGEVGLGRVALARNAADRAIGHFNAVLDRDADNLEARNGLGVAFDLKGLHPQARAQYTAVLQSDPVHLAALNNMALSNTLSGSGETAVSSLRDLAESNLSDATVRQNLAIALFVTGRRSDAEQLAAADLDGTTSGTLFDAVVRYRSAQP